MEMIGKILLVIFFAGVGSANHLYGIIGEAYHAPQPYRFGYQVKDKDSAQHRHEESDGHGNVRGSYGYTDDKGQYREVHYVADKNGFRAQVKTNEAGTANQNPAHVDVKADPPQHHHAPHHHGDIHVPHHHEVKLHHFPQEIKFNHHHIPHHHEEVKLHHHVPQFHHEEVKFHHVPQHSFNHVPSHHEEVKLHHHVPQFHHHKEVKFNHVPQHSFHHVPSHHEEVKIHHHVPQHGFHHKAAPLQGYKKFNNGFNNFSPLHGFSYNPSAFHGYGKWPFQDSNVYGKQQSPWKKHEGFGKFKGFNGISGFDGDFDGQSSSHKGKYEEIMEKIKAYRKDGALSLLGGFKDDNDNFGNGKDWKFGNLDF